MHWARAATQMVEAFISIETNKVGPDGSTCGREAESAARWGSGLQGAAALLWRLLVRLPRPLEELWRQVAILSPHGRHRASLRRGCPRSARRLMHLSRLSPLSGGMRNIAINGQ